MIDLSRQANLIGEYPFKKAAIVGAGAIGSRYCVMFAQMGVPQIELYDGDLLGPENIAGGTFDSRMLGKKKVSSVKSITSLVTGANNIVIPVPDDYTGQKSDAEVLVIGVDSLDKRAAIIKAAIDGKAMENLRWLIDPRIGGYNTSVYTIDLSDKQQYANYLKTYDVTPEPLPCGMKSTAYVTNWCCAAGGNVLRCLTNGITPPYLQHWESAEAFTVVI